MSRMSLENEKRVERLLVLDATYVVVGLLLPQLGNFFPAADIREYLAGTLTLCKCYDFAQHVFPQTNPKTIQVLGGFCMFGNTSALDVVSIVDFTGDTGYPPCIEQDDKAEAFRATVFGYNAVATMIVMLLCLITIGARNAILVHLLLHFYV